jgi:hypothetical protein
MVCLIGVKKFAGGFCIASCAGVKFVKGASPNLVKKCNNFRKLLLVFATRFLRLVTQTSFGNFKHDYLLWIVLRAESYLSLKYCDKKVSSAS